MSPRRRKTLCIKYLCASCKGNIKTARSTDKNIYADRLLLIIIFVFLVPVVLLIDFALTRARNDKMFSVTTRTMFRRPLHVAKKTTGERLHVTSGLICLSAGRVSFGTSFNDFWLCPRTLARYYIVPRTSLAYYFHFKCAERQNFADSR